MKRYRLKESAKDRYLILFVLAVIVFGGLANTYIG